MPSMERPAVQYATAADGVNIAYATFGEGPPVVFAASVFGDLQRYGVPAAHTSRLTDGLVACGNQVVLYDMRGMGSSDREVEDFSLNARVLDIEAVVRRLGTHRFVLAGWDAGTTTALAYTARHPQEISGLVLLNPWLSAARRYESTVLARSIVSLQDLAQKDWSLASLMFANFETMFEDAASAKQLAEAIRGSTSADIWIRQRVETERIDVSDLVRQLSVPALVIYEPFHGFAAFELCQHVAAALPNSRFISVDRTTEVTAIDEFLRSVLSGAVAVDPEPAQASELSVREVEVLSLLACGKSNAQIAEDLVISRNTVIRHVSNIFAKTGASNRAEATSYAYRNRLV
jgi:pimeloyl-ACP methyl ester carboxylesterase/DNA-binding CsgD family transcriptional regulator